MRHIDTVVLKNSQWRRLYFIGYQLCVLIIAIYLKAPWWLVVVAGMLSIVVYVLTLHPAQQLQHITSADITNSSSYWQLLYSGSDNDELWEMSLIEANGFNSCVQLKFDVIHPMPQHRTVVLWQDQVDADSWRKLKVLCRW